MFYAKNRTRFYKSRHLSFLCHTDKRKQILQWTLVVDGARINHVTTEIKVKVKLKWSRYRPGVAQRVGRGIALLFHDHGTRRWWVVSSTPRPHFTPGKDPVPILREAGWAPGSVWTDGKSRPHRNSNSDCPARSQSLYWLTYPVHRYNWNKNHKLPQNTLHLTPTPRIPKQPQSVRNIVKISRSSSCRFFFAKYTYVGYYASVIILHEDAWLPAARGPEWLHKAIT